MNHDIDLLMASTIAVVAIGFLAGLFGLMAAIADHIISPWLERRRLDKFAKELADEYEETMRRG